MSDRGYVAVEKFLDAEKERDLLRARVAELERDIAAAIQLALANKSLDVIETPTTAVCAVKLVATSKHFFADRCNEANHRVAELERERDAAIKGRDEALAKLRDLANVGPCVHGECPSDPCAKCGEWRTPARLAIERLEEQCAAQLRATIAAELARDEARARLDNLREEIDGEHGDQKRGIINVLGALEDALWARNEWYEENKKLRQELDELKAAYVRQDRELYDAEDERDKLRAVVASTTRRDAIPDDDELNPPRK